MNQHKNISIKDIAKLSGVSIATVSRVINNKGGYSDKTKAKVEAIIESHGYVSNMSAKSLREAKTNTIGLIVPNINNDFFSTIALHVENFLFEHGYSVFICNSANDPQKEIQYFKSLASKGVDGILCISGLSELTDDTIFQQTPVVCIDRYPKNHRNLPIVSSDDVELGFLATKHLIESACENILFISSFTAGYDKKDRLTGYKKALAAANIDFREDYVIKTYGDDPSHIETEIAIAKFLKKDIPFDGIFASSDLAALGALAALQRHQLSVPDDVKLIGFDNSLYSRLSSPTITTFNRDPKAMAETACNVLLKTMQGEDLETTEYLIPATLILRESSR